MSAHVLSKTEWPCSRIVQCLIICIAYQINRTTSILRRNSHYLFCCHLNKLKIATQTVTALQHSQSNHRQVEMHYIVPKIGPFPRSIVLHSLSSPLHSLWSFGITKLLSLVALRSENEAIMHNKPSVSTLLMRSVSITKQRNGIGLIVLCTYSISHSLFSICERNNGIFV